MKLEKSPRELAFTMFSTSVSYAMLPIPALLFGIAAGGIGLYGFEGANEGGIRAPLLALGCSFFAICTLAYLTVFKTHSNLTPGFESGAIEMRGGWHLSMAVILIGTAGALIPASEFEKSAKIGCWIVTGVAEAIGLDCGWGVDVGEVEGQIVELAHEQHGGCQA